MAGPHLESTRSAKESLKDFELEYLSLKGKPQQASVLRSKGKEENMHCSVPLMGISQNIIGSLFKI